MKRFEVTGEVNGQNIRMKVGPTWLEGKKLGDKALFSDYRHEHIARIREIKPIDSWKHIGGVAQKIVERVTEQKN